MSKEPKRPCPAVRLGQRNADDRACSKPAGHDGPHSFTVKPDGRGGWKDTP